MVSAKIERQASEARAERAKYNEGLKLVTLELSEGEVAFIAYCVRDYMRSARLTELITTGREPKQMTAWTGLMLHMAEATGLDLDEEERKENEDKL